MGMTIQNSHKVTLKSTSSNTTGNAAMKENPETDGSIRFRKIQNANFLNNMENILPWKSIVSLIEVKYLDSKLGQSLITVETMVRIYFIQLWFKLSDTEAEETLFVCETARDFAQLQRGKDLIPGKAQISAFRHLVKQQELEDEFSQTILLNLIHRTKDDGLSISASS
jgi:IS5 family transposase